MADGIQPQPGIMEIALYQGGASHLDGVSNVLKLSSNENPLGPSDAAKKNSCDFMKVLCSTRV